MKRTVNLGRVFLALLSFAAVMLGGGTGRARGDFVYSQPPSSLGFAQVYGRFANSNFSAFQAGSTYNTASYDSGTGTSGSTATSLVNTWALGATSFTDSASGSSSSAGANDGTGTFANTQSTSFLEWYTELTIDTPALATVSWNATSFTFGGFNVPGFGGEDFGGYTEIDGNGIQILVQGSGSENINGNVLSDVTAGIQSYSSVSGYGTANSVSIVLSPGTYNLESYTYSGASVYGAGYADPYTAGYGSITVNALQSPEPGSLTLLGMGAAGLIGVARRRGRKSAA